MRRSRSPGSRAALLLTGAMLVLTLTPAGASVHDIHLHTDSTPDHVDITSFVTTATSAWERPEDQAIALWRWMVRSHLQTSATFEDGRPLWDPVEFYASYPNSFCGYHAAFLTAYVDVMGGDWRHRYVELGDHTVCEVSWDGGVNWHMFDASMVVYVRDHDGQIASCADIAAASSCETSEHWGAPGAEPGHHYLYHTAPECMTNPPDPDHPDDLGHPSGYRKAADNPVIFSRTLRNGAVSYTSGYEVQEEFTHVRRGWVNRLHLHPGHAYTRFWEPLGTGRPHARLKSNGNDPNDGYWDASIRGNGRWQVDPGFDRADPADGWYALTSVVHRDQDDGTGPRLRPAAGAGVADLVVKVAGANVLTSGEVSMAGTRGAGDTVALAVSRDAGCTWVPVTAPGPGAFAGTWPLNADLIGGAHEILLRVRLEPDATRRDCGLNDLSVTAITQVNRLTLPRLQRGGNQVRFAAGPPRETATLRPSLHAGAEHHWSVSAASHQGLTSRASALGYSSAILVPTTAGTAGTVTWRLDLPTAVTGLRFGGSFFARRQTPEDRVALRYSLDGEDFTTAEVFDAGSAPTWDGRLFATATSVPAGRRTVWLQYELRSSVDASSQSTGIQDALLAVHHAPHDPTFAPVAVTWRWTEHRNEGDVTREHTRVVTTPEETWSINVGGYRDPTMEWVRVRLADGSETPGYDDGQDVGPGAGYDKVRITGSWLDDVALGRPYTVSRPSAAFNPDTGGQELTDGVVVPPVPYRTSGVVQGQTAFWEGDQPLAITVDLGGARTVAAVRVTSHQPDAGYGHAGTIAVTALQGRGAEPVSRSLGVIQHDDIWSPPGPHLDWGYVRSAAFADLPAGGRLAHGYWLVLEQPVAAEQLRLDVVPLAGHGVGLSEIQVFSEVTVGDWPDREIDLGGAPVAVVDEPATGAAAASRRLAVAPNPANPATTIAYDLPRAGPVTLRVVDVRGRLVRTLVDGWRPRGAHRARWDGRDQAGRAVASGRYLAVADLGAVRAVGSITLVR